MENKDKKCLSAWDECNNIKTDRKVEDSLGKVSDFLLQIVNNPDVVQVRIKDRLVETIRKNGSIFTESISKDGYWSFGTNTTIEDFGKFNFTLPDENIENEQ